jgi:hypothetical protein
MSTQAPFRFMGLPKELRLIVYEELPRQIKHTPIYWSETAKARMHPDVVLITRVLPVTILCTSRDVYAEAKAIVQKSAQQFILESEPKIVCGHYKRQIPTTVFQGVSREIELIKVGEALIEVFASFVNGDAGAIQSYKITDES